MGNYKSIVLRLRTIMVLVLIAMNTVIHAQQMMEFETTSDKRKMNSQLEEELLDFKYAPLYWQSIFGLPNDPHKSVIASDGTLLYNFDGKVFDFLIPEPDYKLRIRAEIEGMNEYTSKHQTIYSARVPIFTTEMQNNGISVIQKTWARTPEMKNIEDWSARRVDYNLFELYNGTSQKKSTDFKLIIESDVKLLWDGKMLCEESNKNIQILTLDPIPKKVEVLDNQVQIFYDNTVLQPRGSQKILMSLYSGKFDRPFNHDKSMLDKYSLLHQKALAIEYEAPVELDRTNEELERAIKYWENNKEIPYGKIQVPDKKIQELFDACIRNIYQASELKNGKFMIQIGPGHYRGTWAADGPFFAEALAFLGKKDDSKMAVENLFDNDETDPAGTTFYKRSGLRLWMIKRYAELTGDREWLLNVWPKVVNDVDMIKEYRELSYKDENLLNDGLMPPGAGDGGLGGDDVGTDESEGMSDFNEYTNVYWNLAGLKAAIEMAKSINPDIVDNWSKEYNDFFAVYKSAAERDMLVDAFGNEYVPVTMRDDVPQLPQRGAWAFMHAVYPGDVFDKNDPLLSGMMNMLDNCQKEGTVFGTGWLAHGIWTYFASFYAHAHLWLGHGKKAAATLYAFGNHASPTYVWVEEQYPVGQMRGEEDWGDMPHNWASAEFIRLVRNLIMIEREDELHLLEGMPKSWSEAGKETVLDNIASSFGDVTFKMQISDDGLSANIKVHIAEGNTPKKLVLHLEQFEKPVWNVTVGDYSYYKREKVEINLDNEIDIQVRFKHLVEGRYSH